MGISLVQWNIRGVRANSSWLKDSFFTSSDIIALQETFLRPSVGFSLPGKVIYRRDRVHTSGGGLVTAVSQALSSRLLHFPVSHPFNEVLGVEIQFSASLRLQLVNIYSPPGKLEGHWLDQILRLCSPPFILVGDFNASHCCWGARRSSPQGNIMVDWIIHNDICLLNSSSPTRFAQGVRPSLLDLSLTSPDIFPDTSLSVHPDTFDSDHCPVLLYLNWAISNTNCYSIRRRYDWGAATRILNQNFHIQSPISLQDVEHICKESFAACGRSSRVKIRVGCPWWDSRCSYLLGQKRKHFRLAKRYVCTGHWQQYKKFAALLKREIKDARRTYWANACKAAARSGSIFRILRTLQSRKAPGPTSHRYLRIPDTSIQSCLSEANALACSFARAPIDCFIPLDFSSPVVDSIRRPFQFFELQQSLRSSAHRTPGKDGITLRMLQCLEVENLHLLLNAYNRMWSSGEFPQNWRESLIVPILKPGKDASEVLSYRPIALLSVLSKVFERMLLHRIVPWSLENNIFHPDHYGFMPFRDCAPALMKIYADLLSARDRGEVTVLVALDLAGAYDSVWPDGLALKLLEAGVDGHFVRWIHSSLHRLIQVRWQGQLSDTFDSYVGVPQGAVLSPFLFSVFMRDIFEAFGHNVYGVTYADDTHVYGSGPDLDSAMRNVQNSLLEIAKWCDYWKFTLNPRKCAAIVFSRRKLTPSDHLRIHGVEIPWVSTLRILGLTFAGNLTWSSHVNTLRVKASRRLDVFKSVAHPSRGIGTRDLLRLAQSTVTSSLLHGCQIYSFACPSTLNRLEPVQNAALRIAVGLPRWTPIPILRREAGALSACSSLVLQRRRFLVRHLALGPRSPLQPLLHPTTSGVPLLVDEASTVFSLLQFDATDLLKWVLPLTALTDVEFHTSSFGFQDKNRHPSLILQEFSEFASAHSDWHMIATDASKSQDRTCIAFWDITHAIGTSRTINPLNSIFTAEALALVMALESAPSSGKLIILTDSHSVVSSLRTLTYKSARVLLQISRKLGMVSQSLDAIQIIWVPGHAGIPGNEHADLLARTNTLPGAPVSWVSPEDTCRHLRILHLEDETQSWLSGKYGTVFPHLTKRSWEHRKLRLPRRGEVLLSRLRTRSLPTRALLFRFKLCSSPLCPTCLVPETCDHYLLECRRYGPERQHLYQDLGYSGSRPSFSEVCDLAVSGRRQARRVVSFLLATSRF